MGAVTAFQFVTLAVLARLLSPSDFGLMGIIMVVIGFAQAFADMGISNAIIHRQDATKDQLSSLYWLNILAGVIVFFFIVFIGANCVILPGSIIHENVVIGAGSVVKGEIEENSVYAGLPVKN